MQTRLKAAQHLAGGAGRGRVLATTHRAASTRTAGLQRPVQSTLPCAGSPQLEEGAGGTDGGSASPDAADAAAAPAVTAADMHRLHSIFGGFSHIDAPQDQASCRWFARTFCSFVQELQAGAPAAVSTWREVAPPHLAVLKLVAGSLAASTSHIGWLPEFGCALLPVAAPPGSLKPGHLALHLVSPDKWGFGMHSYPEESHHIATPAGTSFAYCGSVAAADYPSLLAIMHVIIAKEQKAKKEEKPKGIGRSSNFQRTPAFVAVCVKAAAEVVALQQQRNESPNDAEAAAADISLQEPAGGFTDVGLHTAGIRRDTAWPVVWHMIQLTALRILRPAVQPLHFELWLAQALLQQVSPATATADFVSACMTMLKSVAGKAASLAVQQGLDITAVVAACQAARKQLDDAVGQRQLQAAEQFRLPDDAIAVAGNWRLPTGVLPPAVGPTAQQQGLDAARARAAANLGSLACLDDSQGGHARDTLAQLLPLLQAAAASTESDSADVVMQHSLRSTEGYLSRGQLTDGRLQP